MSECPLVFIEWEDSAQPSASWQFLSDFEAGSAVKCTSVGWLIHDGDEMKALAQNMGSLESESSAQVSGVIRIPTRCIVNMVKLEEPAFTYREGLFSRPAQEPKQQVF